MAVVQKRADDVGIAKVHAQFYAGKLGTGAVPVGDVDGIAQEGLVDRDAVPFLEHEMDLVDVEGMQFARAIFDDPVLDVALGDDDVWSCVLRVEQLWLLAFYRDVEIGAAARILWIVWML